MRHLEQAFGWDVAYRRTWRAGRRCRHRGARREPGVVFERDGLTVTAFEVEHMPIDVKTRARLPFDGQTLGFRFDYHGHSLVLSGDTRPSDNLVRTPRASTSWCTRCRCPRPTRPTKPDSRT